ncbi:MAG: aminopeptidase P N-terminal domain-containing protein, partial [Bacteroidales bacterium]|nr:aminopeptidase P N-terminal domain-containing protein [Bacteroidales bacterium]
MFEKEIYTNRRNKLKDKVSNGIALFLGNMESPMNYLANTFHFRQDSSFLYFFGLDFPGLAGVIDFDSGEDYIFGNDVDIDDIIWMGPQVTIQEN